MKNITLPSNGLGVMIMLLLLALIVVVPFSVTFWAVGLMAPWWVALPLAWLASITTFLLLVKFKS